MRKGIEIIEALRGHSTGYAVPQFVVDAPGGGGKIPVNPEYVKEITETELVMRNYEGKEYRYPLVGSGPANGDGQRNGAEVLPGWKPEEILV